MATHHILFVCLGNICRSPMAEGVFRRVAEEEGLMDRFEIDWPVLAIGILGSRRTIARKGRRDPAASTFRVNRHGRWRTRIRAVRSPARHGPLQLRGAQGESACERTRENRFLLGVCAHVGTKDVPDPFFGGTEGSDHALDLIEAAAPACSPRSSPRRQHRRSATPSAPADRPPPPRRARRRRRRARRTARSVSPRRARS